MHNTADNEVKLNDISLKVKNCADCSLFKNRVCSVFSKGNANAQVMLIGEAPGKQENEKGLPFVGKSGEQLDNLLKEAGFENPESEIYFCNVVKCRPVKNNKDRKPSRDEVLSCKKYLLEQINIVKPEIIILCGNTAKNVFEIKEPMKTAHGKMYKSGECKLFPIYHPRASITNEIKIADLRKIKKAVIKGEN